MIKQARNCYLFENIDSHLQFIGKYQNEWKDTVDYLQKLKETLLLPLKSFKYFEVTRIYKTTNVGFVPPYVDSKQ
jgi:hypothetical protein